jgi:hypothetical protein
MKARAAAAAGGVEVSRKAGGIAVLVVAVVALSSGCGAGSSGGSTNEQSVDAAQIEKAANTIGTQCIQVSYEQGGTFSSTKIRLAVDDLIRNFEAAPDQKVDLGAMKADTPRAALEDVLPFVEGKGLGGEQCDQAAADQIHTALAGR